MSPTRWAILAASVAVLLAMVGGAFWWHAGKVDAVRDAAFKDGQALTQAKWDRAVEDAKEAQAQQNEQATDQFTTEREVVRVVYRDRIKEIKTYVPSHGTDCPADAGFLRNYNASASPAGDATDQ